MEQVIQSLKLKATPTNSSRNNFRFVEVVGSLEVQNDSKPFKKLKFENTDEVKASDIEFSDIVSEFSFNSEEPKEKEWSRILGNTSNEQKGKTLDSKLTPKPKKSDKFSTIYTLSSDSSKLQEDASDDIKGVSTKYTTINEDKENIPSRSKEYLEFLPAKKYCKNCSCEVNTTIKLEMPTIPL
jgi:hypothetical protein